MPRLAPDSDEAKRIDAALNEWRQGDVALDECFFVHVADPSMPLSEAAAEANGHGVQALTSEAAGLVVVTQTCDVVRNCMLAKKLQGRLAEKHDKATDEGRGLRALREIRVCAAPSWESSQIEIFFWFVRDDGDASFEGKSWAYLVREWLKLVPASGRFTLVDGQVVVLQDMTAADYVDSDPLDLDHLSSHADG